MDGRGSRVCKYSHHVCVCFVHVEHAGRARRGHVREALGHVGGSGVSQDPRAHVVHEADEVQPALWSFLRSQYLPRGKERVLDLEQRSVRRTHDLWLQHGDTKCL